MKNFNINNYVRIKLTPFGLKVLRENHEELRKKFPSIGKFTPPKIDADGFCEMQLWDVMNTFGKYMVMGFSDLPFETTIRFEDKYLENH